MVMMVYLLLGRMYWMEKKDKKRIFLEIYNNEI